MSNRAHFLAADARSLRLETARSLLTTNHRAVSEVFTCSSCAKLFAHS
jgi:hypothetical protein